MQKHITMHITLKITDVRFLQKPRKHSWSIR